MEPQECLTTLGSFGEDSRCFSVVCNFITRYVLTLAIVVFLNDPAFLFIGSWSPKLTPNRSQMRFHGRNIPCNSFEVFVLEQESCKKTLSCLFPMRFHKLRY